MTNIFTSRESLQLPQRDWEGESAVYSIPVDQYSEIDSFRGEWDFDYSRTGRGRFLHRVFNLLVQGHSLEYLCLKVTKESFIAFLNAKDLVEQFFKLRNINKLDIKCISRCSDLDDDEALSDILDEPEFTSVAQEMISSAQTRVSHAQEPTCTTPASTKSATALTDRLSSVLHHRTALVTHREIAARTAEDHRMKWEEEKKKVTELDRSIEGLDKDIAEMLPAVS